MLAGVPASDIWDGADGGDVSLWRQSLYWAAGAAVLLMQSISEAGHERQPTATHHAVGVRRSSTVPGTAGTHPSKREGARGWPPPDGRDGRQSTVAEDRTGTASGTRQLGSRAVATSDSRRDECLM
jgi:hypothetical protein